MPVKSKASAGKSKDPCAELKRELKDAREQQTAVSDILRVISAMAADVKPALRTIARHAMRLCQSVDARIWLVYTTGHLSTGVCRHLPHVQTSNRICCQRLR
jgi:hypothetical protein